MKLYEFFGNINRDQDPDGEKSHQNKEQEQELSDQIFWYILDHDDLHKKHFLPLAKDIKGQHKEGASDEGHDWKLWMPMVKEGCVEFYKDHDVPGDPQEVFNKDLRVDVCKRLADHHHKDIIKGEYKI